jgi:putative hydrolase of the HAD superfamily
LLALTCVDTLGELSTQGCLLSAEGDGTLRPRAVLFDFYGTLTRAVARGPAHDKVARTLGCEPAEFRRALDVTFYERAVGAFGDAKDAMAAIAESLGRHPSRHALAVAASVRERALQAETQLRAATVPVLMALRRRGIRVAVVSDCGPELPGLWPHLPLAPLVDTRVLSIETRRRKPDPVMYLAACAQLGVAARDCLFVGDGGSRELTGAQAVGMAAVRLAAPDLDGHLAFERDVGWSGPQITTLTAVPRLLSLSGRR